MRKLLFALFFACLVCGCSSSPSVPFLGAFFPGWLLCVTGSLVITIIVRAALIKLDRAYAVGPPALAWPLVAVIISLVIWILFFRN